MILIQPPLLSLGWKAPFYPIITSPSSFLTWGWGAGSVGVLAASFTLLPERLLRCESLSLAPTSLAQG